MKPIVSDHMHIPTLMTTRQIGQRGYPHPGKPINYPDEIPESKSFMGRGFMTSNEYNPDDYRFVSIDDFKWCMTYGGEVNFEWNGKEFCAFSHLQRTEDSPIQILICPSDETEKLYGSLYPDKWCDTPDEALEYVIDGDRLRDIITKVEVTDRTIQCLYFYKETYMKNKIETFDDLCFESVGDFKGHIAHGCEVEFIQNGKYYSITHPEGKICIGRGYYLKDGKAHNALSKTEYNVDESTVSDDVDDILEYTAGEDKLRNVVKKIGIVFRSIQHSW